MKTKENHLLHLIMMCIVIASSMYVAAQQDTIHISDTLLNATLIAAAVLGVYHLICETLLKYNKWIESPTKEDSNKSVFGIFGYLASVNPYVGIAAGFLEFLACLCLSLLSWSIFYYGENYRVFLMHTGYAHVVLISMILFVLVTAFVIFMIIIATMVFYKRHGNGNWFFRECQC